MFILRNLKVRRSLHNSAPLDHIQSQADSVHILTSYFIKMHLNIILRSMSTSPTWSMPFIFPEVMKYDTHRKENDASKNSSIAAFEFFAAGTCLPGRCLATIGGIQTLSKVISWAYRSFTFSKKESKLKNIWTCLHIHNNINAVA
jgi:hypothetical protein